MLSPGGKLNLIKQLNWWQCVGGTELQEETNSFSYQNEWKVNFENTLNFKTIGTYKNRTASNCLQI